MNVRSLLIHINYCRSLINGGERIIYILDSYESCINKAQYIEQLTDLKVGIGKSTNDNGTSITDLSSVHVKNKIISIFIYLSVLLCMYNEIDIKLFLDHCYNK